MTLSKKTVIGMPQSGQMEIQIITQSVEVGSRRRKEGITSDINSGDCKQGDFEELPQCKTD